MDIFWLPKFWNFLDILTILVVSWKMISEIRAVLKKLSHLLPLAISQIANYTSISSHSSLRPLINQWMGGEWGFLFVYVSLLFSYSSPLIVGPESFVSQPYSTIASIYKRLEWESLLKSHTLFSCIDTLLITQAKTKLIYHQLFLVNVCWLQVYTFYKFSRIIP